MAIKAHNKDEQLKQAFNKIKEELADHLETINENTNEMQANYEYIQRLELKIDKLNEKLEQLMMFMECEKTMEKETKTDELKQLKFTIREQELFLLLYTSGDFQSYAELGRKLGLTSSLVSNYLTNLLEKGVPLVKRYANKQPTVRLESWFKELQAKESIIPINPRVARRYNL